MFRTQEIHQIARRNREVAATAPRKLSLVLSSTSAGFEALRPTSVHIGPRRPTSVVFDSKNVWETHSDHTEMFSVGLECFRYLLDTDLIVCDEITMRFQFFSVFDQFLINFGILSQSRPV